MPCVYGGRGHSRRLAARQGAVQFRTQHDGRSGCAGGAGGYQISAERRAALDAFYAEWHDDALVLDKWFAIQAMSPLPGTPEAVRSLAAHPDFDLRNPNRVRSLVGSFASANQVRFHDASGAGYRFLADIIIALDPLNPQTAARISSPLGQWRRVDAGRQTLMQHELRRIQETPGLSTNAQEMVTRSLGA